MYEAAHQPLISRSLFHRRVCLHFLASLALIAVSLGIGMWGYEHYEQLLWRDAFENAAMLLGGMGPVDKPVTNGGKVFAGVYALYAGLLFLILAGVIFAPVLHRILHRLHMIDDGEPGT